jgi:hypothetical protein
MNLLKNIYSLNEKQIKVAKNIFLMTKRYFLDMTNKKAEKEVNMI